MGSSFVLADLEARPSFSLTVLPALLLGMGNLNLRVQVPLLRSLSLGLPYSGDEAMIF